MWIPVIESSKVKAGPVRVVYWGTPVVLFRGSSGQVGALEDACPHRRMRLSRGSVVGDNIRCGLHFLQFDRDGRCAAVPDAMKTEASFKEKCSAFRFFVREARGQVWLSPDDDPALFFPAQLLGAEGSRVDGWHLEVKGDPQVWLDHFLDYSHVPFTHFSSTFTGKLDSPPEMVREPAPDNGDGYPIRYGKFSISNGWRRSFLLKLAQARTLRTLAARLIPKEDSAKDEIQIDVTMHTPACHQFTVTYRSRFGTKVLDFVNFANPISSDRLIFSDFVTLRPEARWPWNLLESRLVGRVARIDHVIHEDEPWFSTAATTDLDRMSLTPVDDLLVRGRKALAEYAKKKGSRFPEDSYLRRF